MKTFLTLYTPTNYVQTIIANGVMLVIYIISCMTVYYVIPNSHMGHYTSEISKIIPDSLNWFDPNLADIIKRELEKNLELNSGSKTPKLETGISHLNDSDSIHCLVGIDERLISNNLIVSHDRFKLKERGICFLTNDLDHVFCPTMRFVVTHSFECDSIGWMADVYISKEAGIRLGIFSDQKKHSEICRMLLHRSHALNKYGLITE